VLLERVIIEAVGSIFQITLNGNRSSIPQELERNPVIANAIKTYGESSFVERRM